MSARPPRRGFRSRRCRRSAGCFAGPRTSTSPPPVRWRKQQVEGHTHGGCDSAAVGADRITEVTTTARVATTRVLRYRLAEAPERGRGQHQRQRCPAAAALATRRWWRSSRFQNAGRSPPRRAAPTNGCSRQPLLTAARSYAVVGITSVAVEADAGQWEQTRELQPLESAGRRRQAGAHRHWRLRQSNTIAVHGQACSQTGPWGSWRLKRSIALVLPGSRVGPVVAKILASQTRCHGAPPSIRGRAPSAGGCKWASALWSTKMISNQSPSPDWVGRVARRHASRCFLPHLRLAHRRCDPQCWRRGDASLPATERCPRIEPFRDADVPRRQGPCALTSLPS